MLILIFLTGQHLPVNLYISWTAFHLPVNDQHLYNTVVVSMVAMHHIKHLRYVIMNGKYPNSNS